MTKTKKEIEYRVAPYGLIATIPAGTPVEKAANLEERPQFWVCPWPNMSEQAESWQRNYGFLVDINEVE